MGYSRGRLALLITMQQVQDSLTAPPTTRSSQVQNVNSVSVEKLSFESSHTFIRMQRDAVKLSSYFNRDHGGGGGLGRG